MKEPNENDISFNLSEHYEINPQNIEKNLENKAKKFEPFPIDSLGIPHEETAEDKKIKELRALKNLQAKEKRIYKTYILPNNESSSITRSNISYKKKTSMPAINYQHNYLVDVKINVFDNKKKEDNKDILIKDQQEIFKYKKISEKAKENAPKSEEIIPVVNNGQIVFENIKLNSGVSYKDNNGNFKESGVYKGKINYDALLDPNNKLKMSKKDYMNFVKENGNFRMNEKVITNNKAYNTGHFGNFEENKSYVNIKRNENVKEESFKKEKIQNDFRKNEIKEIKERNEVNEKNEINFKIIEENLMKTKNPRQSKNKIEVNCPDKLKAMLFD